MLVFWTPKEKLVNTVLSQSAASFFLIFQLTNKSIAVFFQLCKQYDMPFPCHRAQKMTHVCPIMVGHHDTDSSLLKRYHMKGLGVLVELLIVSSQKREPVDTLSDTVPNAHCKP